MIAQKTKIRLGFLGILVLSFLCAYYVFPKAFERIGIQGHSKPFVLGLDLQGGTQLIYEANKEQLDLLPLDERYDAVNGVRDVIERRVNTFGVSEPIVQTSKADDRYRIIVELAGVNDVKAAIDMIGETPILEFKEEATSTPELTEEEKKQIEEYNVAAKTKASGILQQALDPKNDFGNLAKEFSEEPNVKDTLGDIGWAKRGELVKEFEDVCFDTLKNDQVHENVIETQFGFHIIKKLNERISEDTQSLTKDEAKTEEEPAAEQKEVNCQHILIRTHSIYDIHPELAFGNWKDTKLSGEQLETARVTFNQTGFPEVTLNFNKEGEKLFEEITRRNIGKQVAIFLDGQPISTPVVQTAITGGSAVISGKFSLADAKELSQRLNAGALKVPIELISQQTVGATLGKLSIEKSLNAGIIGLISVAIFMILFYRLPGILSVIALCVYGLLVLSIFKFIPVTLSLAGIAGFILSLGMAVDANVLVFERLKEELKTKYPLDICIHSSFKRAWPSIRDGNISTLITCVILIWFSSSVVKGFAITLAVGILVSMFSAMTVTQILMLVTKMKFVSEKIWLYGGSRK